MARKRSGCVCIEADHYREEIARLMKDPIVVALASEIPPGTDTSELMNAANREYHARGGKGADSLGGVIRAIRKLLGEEE